MAWLTGKLFYTVFLKVLFKVSFLQSYAWQVPEFVVIMQRRKSDITGAGGRWRFETIDEDSFSTSQKERRKSDITNQGSKGLKKIVCAKVLSATS